VFDTLGAADRVDVLNSVSFALQVNGRKHIVHRLDGRTVAMDPKELLSLARELAMDIDMDGVDYIVAFPEGGVLPAFAFAQIVDRPLLLPTRLHLMLSPVISFEEPHTRLGTTHYLHGLRAAHRVVIIDDEVTTGQTIINAVRALRAAGVHVNDVGVLLAMDTPALWQAMADAGISLHVVIRVPPTHGERAGKPDAP